MKVVNNSDLVNADGQAVVWASKYLGKPVKERVSGIDLMHNTVALAHKKGYKIYLLGAKQQVVEKVAKTYANQYSQELVAGYRDGYFSHPTRGSNCNRYSTKRGQLLFVAISSPMKENFLYKHRDIFTRSPFYYGRLVVVLMWLLDSQNELLYGCKMQG